MFTLSIHLLDRPHASFGGPVCGSADRLQAMDRRVIRPVRPNESERSRPAQCAPEPHVDGDAITISVRPTALTELGAMASITSRNLAAARHRLQLNTNENL